MSNKDHAILSIHIIIGITTNEMLTTPRDYFLGCTVTIVLRNIASNTLWLKLTWNDPYNCSIGLELDICVNDIEVLLFVTSCIRHFVKIKCENQGRITLIMCIGYENLNRMIYAQCRPGIIVILRNACALFCYLYGACTLKWGAESESELNQWYMLTCTYSSIYPPTPGCIQGTNFIPIYRVSNSATIQYLLIIEVLHGA